MNIKLSDTMEGRATQIGALKLLVDSLEKELEYYRKNWKVWSKKNEDWAAEVESERQMNAILTEELESLKKTKGYRLE